MQPRQIALFICFLIVTTSCYAQSKTEIIYTGKLMGYFRSPDKQAWDQARGCTAAPDSSSEAAKQFQDFRRHHQNAVVVGTGDNFAPELAARMFMLTKAKANEPKDKKDDKKAQANKEQEEKLRNNLKIPSGEYIPGNKELYYWDEMPKHQEGWVYYKSAPPDLLEELARGEGTIPTDNVGCFLAMNRFAAIVPGKHDFYFGVERVRELARFMAGLTKEKVSKLDPESDQKAPNPKDDYQPPQMLGANLVIKTSLTDPPSPSTGKPRSQWEGASLKIGDGKSIYPWFVSSATVKIQTPDSKAIRDKLQELFKDHPNPTLQQVEQKLNEPIALSPKDTEDLKKLKSFVHDLATRTTRICFTTEQNYVPAGCVRGWTVTGETAAGKTVSGNADGMNYVIPTIPKELIQSWSGNLQAPFFEAGQNYGLCLMSDPPKKDPNGLPQKDIETECQTFSVYRPFLSFPDQRSPTASHYHDPDPFVLVPDPNNKQEREVAIFGVVDPSVTQYIGVLNYSWLNKDDKLKSALSVEEPLEAIREQLAYFDLWYKKTHAEKEFKGMTVLLAEMSPHIARKLAARLNRFQLVVTEADEELANSETVISIDWNSKVNSSAFVAVPAPYYQSDSKGNEEGKVHFGSVNAENKADGGWSLTSAVETPAKVTQDYLSDDDLANLLRPGLAGCVDSKYVDIKPDGTPKYPKYISKNPQEIVRIATLCAMRDRLGTDVALIQKRDRFIRVPAYLTDVQQILDYLIWKGDLLTLLYVPGSAIKKSLDLSKKYENDDQNDLSLADEKNRALESLGIVSRGKDFLINEVPIDDKKTYAIAATDYIAGGDTGYPDLAAAALDPKTRPTQYPDKLKLISSLVCARIAAAKSKAGTDTSAEVSCLGDIGRDDYLDQIKVNPPPSPPGKEGLGSKLWKLFPFKLGDETQKQTSAFGDSNQRVEQRAFWVLSLKNFGITFSGLSNNMKDADVDARYAGVKASGVTAHKTQSTTTALDLRLSRMSHTGGPFAALTTDYRRQSTGDVTPDISQKANLVTGEAGYLRNLRGGRSDKSMGLSFSFYTETQLQRPFSNFGLGTGDSIKISQNRSFMLLPRIGLFWRYGAANTFSAGVQDGRELRALVGYSFETPAGMFQCLPEVVRTFAKCIKDLSPKSNPKVTANSAASAILDDRPRAGFYWNSGFTVPINSKVSYVFSDKGNYFFNFSGDNATDTRYRDESKHSLKFTIWPSFSIGPSLRLLLYRNKVNKDFLFQKEFGFETSFAFDLFNRREKDVQIKHKP